jgi:septal ring factor EnvC (AmiA/AmiB activator)
MSNSDADQKTPNLDSESEVVVVTPKSEEKVATNTSITQPKNNWKPIALASILGLALCIAILGFQSWQISGQSEKIRRLEQKAVAEQVNLSQIDTLNKQLTTQSQELSLTKNELETKSKLFSELQQKASTQADKEKEKEALIAKLESENKSLSTKNANLVAENARIKDNASSIRDRINTIFAPR